MPSTVQFQKIDVGLGNFRRRNPIGEGLTRGCYRSGLLHHYLACDARQREPASEHEWSDASCRLPLVPPTVKSGWQSIKRERAW